jgi:DNA-binding Lrp family transcriptional regulator
VTFDLTGGDNSPNDGGPGTSGEEPVSLDEEDKRLVRAVQSGLPVEPEPYAALAGEVGRPVEEVLNRLDEWLDCGVIRRMGVIANHRKLGYDANGMAVFNVSEERADEIGPTVASHPQVTHCYRRPRLPDWPYTLFAMIHDDTRQAVVEHADELAEELDIEDHDVLFSTEEFKKSSGQYFD